MSGPQRERSQEPPAVRIKFSHDGSVLDVIYRKEREKQVNTILKYTIEVSGYSSMNLTIATFF